MTFDLSPATLPHVFGAGQRLELRVSVGNGSSNDVLFGYDSTDTPSVVTMGGSALPAPAPIAVLPWSLLLLDGGATVASRRRLVDITDR